MKLRTHQLAAHVLVEERDGGAPPLARLHQELARLAQRSVHLGDLRAEACACMLHVCM